MKDVKGVFESFLEGAVNEKEFHQIVARFSRKDIKSFFKNEKEFKKAIKNIYKNNKYLSPKIHKNFEMMLKHKSLVNNGVYYYKNSNGTCDYDSWKDWYIIEVPTEDNEEKMINEAYKFLDYHIGEHINFDDEPINSPYDCTGLTFSNAMRFTVVGKNRVLATKYYAIDV